MPLNEAAIVSCNFLETFLELGSPSPDVAAAPTSNPTSRPHFFHADYSNLSALGTYQALRHGKSYKKVDRGSASKRRLNFKFRKNLKVPKKSG